MQGKFILFFPIQLLFAVIGLEKCIPKVLMLNTWSSAWEMVEHLRSEDVLMSLGSIF